VFTADQFTPTKFDTAEQKAKFANHFVHFVESDFREMLFELWFYRKLSNCFQHIAHYNRDGFYETWFSTTEKRLDFLANAERGPAYGDPAWTYSDVERVLSKWVRDTNICNKYANLAYDQKQTLERAELARLKAKYE
jgi:hypothetical protein